MFINRSYSLAFQIMQTDRPHPDEFMWVTIVDMSDQILVDVWGKYVGVVTDESRVDPAFLESLRIGQEIPIYINGWLTDRGDNVYGASLAQGLLKAEWDEAYHIYQEREEVEVEVYDIIPRGLLVLWRDFEAFIPRKKLSPKTLAPNQDILTSDLLYKKLMVRAIEVSPPRRRLVFSEVEQSKEEKVQFFKELQIGDVREGVVLALRDFGAFLDLDGGTGLVLNSEISSTSIKHPSEVLTVGQRITVVVIGIDREKYRIAVSLK